MEALMSAAVGEYPVQSVSELQPLREAVAECIELLSEQDQFVVNAVNSEMISLEKLGKRLGVSKPHAWRLRNAAYDRLRVHLLAHPIIRERLFLDDDESGYSGF
jgi:DNA-directed RNA polymerase specialized sigma subunit